MQQTDLYYQAHSHLILGMCFLVIVGIVLYKVFLSKKIDRQPDPKRDFGDKLVQDEHYNRIGMWLGIWAAAGIIGCTAMWGLLQMQFNAPPNVVGFGCVVPLVLGVGRGIYVQVRGEYQWSWAEGVKITVFLAGVVLVPIMILLGWRPMGAW